MLKNFASLAQVLTQIPGNASTQWPQGQRFAPALAHGTMSVELYAPVINDPQQPHAQDELYIIAAGTGILDLNGVDYPFIGGDVLFVPAGQAHFFKSFSENFKTWVVFWGPQGGEQ